MNIAIPVQEDTPASLAEISGNIGTLSTRLAVTGNEIREAQRVRYKVFCEEMSARKNPARFLTRREKDAHDKVCDHLLVIDKPVGSVSRIVGTQRFFVKSALEKKPSFYSQPEFDLEALAEKFPQQRFMELGRSCILPAYREKRTMELMWHGTWAYALKQKADVMVGCASFQASNFEKIGPGLGFLGEYALCQPEWDTPALGRNAVPLRQFTMGEVSQKRALASLPPLIKGYLRLGAKFASHAVPDPDFGTIDILVVLPVSAINPRYVNYYGADASRHRGLANPD
jgi:putative hemolysin